MWNIFQESEMIIDLERTFVFIFHFSLKTEPIILFAEG